MHIHGYKCSLCSEAYNFRSTRNERRQHSNSNFFLGKLYETNHQDIIKYITISATKFGKGDGRWWDVGPRWLSLVFGDDGQGDCRWYWEMLAKVIVAGIGRCWPRWLSLVLGDVGQGDCRWYWEMLAKGIVVCIGRCWPTRWCSLVDWRIGTIGEADIALYCPRLSFYLHTLREC